LRVAVRTLVRSRELTRRRRTLPAVTWAFIEDLYREYCLARLQEMRKYRPRA
jgi:hypothetical protein